MPTPSQPGKTDSLVVSWPDMVKFVRQLSHDIRNNLNAVELQSAYLALLELFTNAFQHERNVKTIDAKAFIDKNRLVFELREPKSQFAASTENWGREPLRNVSQGH